MRFPAKLFNMKPLKSSEISGNWATLLLPVEPDNRINFQLLKEQVRLQILAGVDGIYSNGTAGEFHNQTEAEFDQVSDLLAEACHASGIKFQIGCSHVNPLMSLDRVQRAVQLQPGAIQVILPDWVACGPDEATAFLEKIAACAGDIGIVLYNPGHARTLLKPADFLELKKRIPSLVGCKVAWTDPALIADMAVRVSGVSLFVPGHHLASGVMVGARGAYSNVACLNPRAAQRWYESMEHSLTGALELERRIQAFMNSCIVPYLKDQHYSNTAADKFLAAVGGWCPITPRLRWPYKSIPESEIMQVRREGEKMLPEFFSQTNATL